MAVKIQVQQRTLRITWKATMGDKRKGSIAMNADALRLREKTKRQISQDEVERALASLRAMQFSSGRKTDSVKILRKLRS